MPLFYQPSRSSRHRKACLALYKALQRIGARVPLPPDIETGLGPENPIKTLIRNGFRRNKNDSSPRLVSAALKNGYRYIDLLFRASSTSSPEHASVLQFLQENRDRVLWLKFKTAAKKAALPNSAPVPGAVPILTKISDPDDWQNPVYVPTRPARPLSEIPNGIRKPPRLDAAGTIPFLRLGKPQGRHITRVLRQKNARRQARTVAIAEMQSDEMDEARLEDNWERLVGEQMVKEGLWKPAHKVQLDLGLQSKRELTFATTMYQGIMSLSALLERERLDMVARAKAFLEIEQREQKLADQEDQGRIERREWDAKDVEKFRKSMKRSKRGRKAGVFGQQQLGGEEGAAVAPVIEGIENGETAINRDTTLRKVVITPKESTVKVVEMETENALVKPGVGENTERLAEVLDGVTTEIPETPTTFTPAVLSEEVKSTADSPGSSTGQSSRKSLQRAPQHGGTKKPDTSETSEESIGKLKTKPSMKFPQEKVQVTRENSSQRQQQQQQQSSGLPEDANANEEQQHQQRQRKKEKLVASYTKKTRKRFTERTE